MRASVEFLAGLLVGPQPIRVTADDYSGPHSPALRVWQRHGFLATEPEPHWVPSCPHCGEGVPIHAGDKFLCGTCLSDIDPRHLSAWRFDVASFLIWLAREIRIDGAVRQIDDVLWQLGSRTADGVALEYFFCSGNLSDHGRLRLLAYRNAVLVQPLSLSDTNEGFRGERLSLVDLVTMTQDRIAGALPRFTDERSRAVRFDTDTGTICIGNKLAGEVPLGSKEFFLLACLAENLDRYVAYADLKYEVLHKTGSRDTTDEATFCQKLKGRIKKKWMPDIDRLIATTNKGDGYRLRGLLA